MHKPAMSEPDLAAMTSEEFNRVRTLMYAHSGVVLDAKQTMVEGRLRKRMRTLGVRRFGEYLGRVEDEAPELAQFINALTTNKTAFFRESHHFDALRARARALVASGQRRLRVWSAASSSGQEPFSIAMLLADELAGTTVEIEVVATDIDTQMLARAQAGRYPLGELEEVPPPLRRFFRSCGPEEVEVVASIRELVSFKRLNLIDRPWALDGRFDVIFCRNVMIYFDRETQQGIVQALIGKLQPGGVLFAGHSESLHFMFDVLEPIGPTSYRPRLARRKLSAPGLPSTPGIRTIPATTAARALPPIGHARPKLRTLRPGQSAERLSHVAAEPFPEHLPRIHIQAGGVHASQAPTVVCTVLGSCIAACLWDPEAGVGGMNHFMLPHDPAGRAETEGAAARFGIHAMELLINGILGAGGVKSRLLAKLVGGAMVLGSDDRVARENLQFARKFLQVEGIPITSERTGGQLPMVVHFVTTSGRARVRTVESNLAEVCKAERRYSDQLAGSSDHDTMGITLFGGDG